MGSNMRNAAMTVLFSTVAVLFRAVHAIEMPDVLKKAVPNQLQPWYERSYPFTFIRTPVIFRPIDFKYEGAFLGVALLYFIVHRIGQARNRTLATAWLQAAMPLLEDEFAFVAKQEAPNGQHWSVGEGAGKLLWNGGADAMAYASGRRGVERLRIEFLMAPLHDPIELVYKFVRNTVMASSEPVLLDTISLTFLLPYQSPDNVSGVFAIADKTVLRDSRRGRFDLTFSKVLDGDNANSQRQLDDRFAIMSECGELTDALLGEIGDRGSNQRHRVGLQAALNSEAGAFLYNIILSDQPAKRPETGAVPVEKRIRRLTLTMRMPHNQRDAKTSLALVEAACNLVDALELGHAKLSNSVLSKLRQTRATVDKELTEEVTKWDKEEEEEAREAAKRKAEKEKFDKLSPAEQERRAKVEKKRQQRKAQTKTVKGR